MTWFPNIRLTQDSVSVKLILTQRAYMCVLACKLVCRIVFVIKHISVFKVSSIIIWNCYTNKRVFWNEKDKGWKASCVCVLCVQNCFLLTTLTGPTFFGKKQVLDMFEKLDRFTRLFKLKSLFLFYKHFHTRCIRSINYQLFFFNVFILSLNFFIYLTSTTFAISIFNLNINGI